jgi:hypothetical protein
MEGVELLRDAADALASLDPETLSDEELGAGLVEWHRLEARLVASRARVMAVFECRRAYAADGLKCHPHNLHKGDTLADTG